MQEAWPWIVVLLGSKGQLSKGMDCLHKASASRICLDIQTRVQLQLNTREGSSHGRAQGICFSRPIPGPRSSTACLFLRQLERNHNSQDCAAYKSKALRGTCSKCSIIAMRKDGEQQERTYMSTIGVVSNVSNPSAPGQVGEPVRH